MDDVREGDYICDADGAVYLVDHVERGVGFYAYSTGGIPFVGRVFLFLRSREEHQYTIASKEVRTTPFTGDDEVAYWR